MDHSGPGCFWEKEAIRSLQWCLIRVWDHQMFQDTGAWDYPISQGLVVFQAVLGHLMKSGCEFLSGYNFLKVLYKIGFGFSLYRWLT
jgi:hypothetical protein